MCSTSVHVQYSCSCAVQLFMCSTAVHVQYSCQCTVQLSMCSTAVHVQYSCSFAVQLFMYVTAVHVQYSCSYSVQLFMFSTRYSCQTLIKIGFCRQTVEKYSNIKKIRPVTAEMFRAADRQTDRYDEVNCRISQFCEGVSNPLTDAGNYICSPHH